MKGQNRMNKLRRGEGEVTEIRIKVSHPAYVVTITRYYCDPIRLISHSYALHYSTFARLFRTLAQIEYYGLLT